MIIVLQSPILLELIYTCYKNAENKICKKFNPFCDSSGYYCCCSCSKYILKNHRGYNFESIPMPKNSDAPSKLFALRPYEKPQPTAQNDTPLINTSTIFFVKIFTVFLDL